MKDLSVSLLIVASAALFAACFLPEPSAADPPPALPDPAAALAEANARMDGLLADSRLLDGVSSPQQRVRLLDLARARRSPAGQAHAASARVHADALAAELRAPVQRPSLDDLERRPAWMAAPGPACRAFTPAGSQAIARHACVGADTGLDRDVWQLLADLQFPADCRQARLLVHEPVNDAGIGAEMHWLQVALTAAVETNRTLVVRGPWAWAPPDSPCGPEHAGMACVFEPVSWCQYDGPRDSLPRIQPTDLHAHAEARVVAWQSEHVPAFARTVPKRVAAGGRGRLVFWWRSRLARFTFRPRRAVAAAALRSARRQGLLDRVRPSAGVHVRAGDKTHGDEYQVQEMAPAGVPTAALHEAARVCGMAGLFVASRDPAIANATSALPWPVRFDRGQLRYGDGFHTKDVLDGKMPDPFTETVHYVRDVMLLADSEFLFGPFESNVSRLVAELACAFARLSALPVATGEQSYIIWP